MTTTSEVSGGTSQSSITIIYPDECGLGSEQADCCIGGFFKWSLLLPIPHLLVFAILIYTVVLRNKLSHGGKDLNLPRSNLKSIKKDKYYILYL